MRGGGLTVENFPKQLHQTWKRNHRLP
jgi:hypothetical protein